MWTCQAQIVWQGRGTTTEIVVHSTRDLEPGEHDVVVRHPAHEGRSIAVSSFDELEVVPADMPAGTGESGMMQMALNLGASIIIFAPAIIALSRLEKKRV